MRLVNQFGISWVTPPIVENFMRVFLGSKDKEEGKATMARDSFCWFVEYLTRERLQDISAALLLIQWAVGKSDILGHLAKGRRKYFDLSIFELHWNWEAIFYYHKRLWLFAFPWFVFSFYLSEEDILRPVWPDISFGFCILKAFF